MLTVEVASYGGRVAVHIYGDNTQISKHAHIASEYNELLLRCCPTRMVAYESAVIKSSQMSSMTVR